MKKEYNTYIDNQYAYIILDEEYRGNLKTYISILIIVYYDGCKKYYKGRVSYCQGKRDFIEYIESSLNENKIISIKHFKYVKIKYDNKIIFCGYKPETSPKNDKNFDSVNKIHLIIGGGFIILLMILGFIGIMNQKIDMIDHRLHSLGEKVDEQVISYLQKSNDTVNVIRSINQITTNIQFGVMYLIFMFIVLLSILLLFICTCR